MKFYLRKLETLKFGYSLNKDNPLVPTYLYDIDFSPPVMAGKLPTVVIVAPLEAGADCTLAD